MAQHARSFFALILFVSGLTSPLTGDRGY